MVNSAFSENGIRPFRKKIKGNFIFACQIHCMNKALKLIVACAGCILFVIVLYIAGVFIIGIITNFNPTDKEELPFKDETQHLLNPEDTLTILTWNIGYAGLGKEMDFFYEDGKMVRPTKEQSYSYFEGIKSFLHDESNVDFIFLQEVDFKSRRSYKINQFDALQTMLTNHPGLKVINYKSGFVPVPFYDPTGSVNSGMVVFSRSKISKAFRHSTPGKHKWPKRLFMSKRCFLEIRINLGNDKELVLINLHNSAFGDEKKLREAELAMLHDIIVAEFELGNYVIAGGDWNQNPPGMDVKKMNRYISREVWPIQENFLSDEWSWAYDPSLPTNRDVEKPFDFTRSTCTILDYFVTSPNIKVIEVKTFDLEFNHSDHQPVLMAFKLL